MQKYLDFDLLIEEVDEGLRVRVLNSPSGQTRREFSLPFQEMEIENYLLKLGSTRRGVRSASSPQVQVAREFGGKLYSAVFSGGVATCLRNSLDEARRQDAGLRIRLRLDAPGLSNLPWEYLMDPDLNRFLSLTPETPIVRYIDLPESIRPIRAEPPLRALVMIASPEDYPPLDAEREWQNLVKATSETAASGLITLERVKKPSMEELLHQLNKGKYHIFHFIGHGSFNRQTQDGTLILENAAGQGRAVSGNEIGMVLQPHRTLRLAVLNACEGARTSAVDPFAGVAQSLVQQGIPAVVAMQFEVSDEAAIGFAHELYARLAESVPVDRALADARRLLFARGNYLEWGTPVLYLRAPDGLIFDIQRPGAAIEDTGENRTSRHRRMTDEHKLPEIKRTTDIPLPDPIGWLVGLDGDHKDKRYALYPGETIVGRDDSANLVISEGRISRRHARFTARNNELMMDDLGSTNGSFINDKQIQAPTKLSNGNVVSLGGIKLRLELPTPPAVPDKTPLPGTLSAISGIAGTAPMPASSLTDMSLAGQVAELLENAQQALSEGEWATAAATLQAAQALQPGNPEIVRMLQMARQRQTAELVEGHMLAARQALSNGKLEEAIQRAQSAVNLDVTNNQARGLLQEAQTRQRDEKIGQLMQEATQAISQNDLSRAQHQLQSVLTVDPGHSQAQSLLREVTAKQNAARIAQLRFESQESFSRGQWDTAVQRLRQLLALDPGDAEATTLLAQAQANQAEGYFAAYYDQAQKYYNQNMKRMALDSFMEISKRRSDYRDVSEWIERIQTELGDRKPGGTAPLSGSTGVFSTPDATQQPSHPVTEPATGGDTPRVYSNGGLTLQQLANRVRDHFMSKGYETQVVTEGDKLVIQGRKGGLRSLVGMGTAASVMLDVDGVGFKAQIGGAKWVEQGAAIAVSMFVLWPLLLTGGAGMLMQKGLIDELWRIVDMYAAEQGANRIS